MLLFLCSGFLAIVSAIPASVLEDAPSHLRKLLADTSCSYKGSDYGSWTSKTFYTGEDIDTRGDTYRMNVCADLKTGDDCETDNAMLCQTHEGSLYNLGSWTKDPAPTWSTIEDLPTLTFTNGQLCFDNRGLPKPRNTYVSFTTTGSAGTFTATENDNCEFFIKFSVGGLSGGSKFMIAVVSLLFAYLVFGMLFMKYKKGATGLELIPNVSFWAGLPSLVKDGCLFTCNKCKSGCRGGGGGVNSDAYDEI